MKDYRKEVDIVGKYQQIYTTKKKTMEKLEEQKLHPSFS